MSRGAERVKGLARECTGESLSRDDTVKKASKYQEDKTQAGYKAELPSDVQSQPRISPYDVTSGLAMLPKVTTLLL